MKQDRFICHVGPYLLFLFIGCLISCTSPASKKEVWCQPINDLVNAHSDLSFRNPDSLRLLLSQHPIAADDSLNWYYRMAQYARCYFFNNQPDSVTACLDRVDAFASRSTPSPSLSTLLAFCKNIRAVSLQTCNHRDSALVCLKLAYQEVCKADMRHEMPNICLNAADVCRQRGKLPEASFWLHRAMVAADSLQMPALLHNIHIGLGVVYAELHNFKLAQHYFITADTLYPAKNAYDKYSQYNSWGNCYYYEHKDSEALACFRKAYETAKPFQQLSTNAIIEGNMGEMFLRLGQLDSSRYYLDSANSHLSATPDADDGILFYLNGLYASLALAQNDLPAAKHYLSQPFNPSRIGPNYLYLHNKRLMEYYSKVQDYKKAYHYQQFVTLYDDSIRNALHLSSITEIDYRYRQDTALLRRDIVIANTSSRVSHLQSTTILSIALLLLTIIGGIAVYGYLNRCHERKRREQLGLITQLRMENVRNRFSPHFIFNVLNSVVGSLHSKEGELLPLLVQVLRTNLMVSDKIAIPLQDEMDLVKKYAALRRSTHPQTPLLEWEIAPDIQFTWLLPTMIIQIPVENAIKHASADFIHISISRIDKYAYQITIEDNGIGYTPGAHNEDKNSTGTGLRILYRTVELLNLKNTQKMGFEIKSCSTDNPAEHGTCVRIMIPFIYNYNV